jgi:hypothetical protein
MNKINDALQSLANTLKPFDDAASKLVLKAKKSSPQEIANDLTLWGSSGSLMDQAIEGERGDARRAFEVAAISLGNALVEAGARNERMENWVKIFEQWKHENV